jgi:hypothetical protein
MLEIFLLIVFTVRIAALARAGGGRPWFWSALMVAGYIVVPLTVMVVSLESYGAVWFYCVAIPWVAGLFLCAHLVLGRGRANSGNA